jgi:hypothetical protein
MRRAGLRLAQLWLPDTRVRGFAQECRRQSLLAAKNKHAERDALAWIDATRDVAGWTS